MSLFDTRLKAANPELSDGKIEDYYLPRNLVGREKTDSDDQDAMMGVLEDCMDYDWEEKMLGSTYSLWGAKTQGHPYHMYLLSIACLIEDRLGEKAFVYGDIHADSAARR